MKKTGMKRIQTLTGACLLAFSLTACSGGTEETADTADTGEVTDISEVTLYDADYSNQTITGKVTAINGTEITLLLGELSDAPELSERPDGGEAPDGKVPDGEAPDGGAPDGEAPDGGAPDGEAPDGTAPDGEVPNGTAPDGEVPDGETPDGTAPDDQKANGEKPNNANNDRPDDIGAMGEAPGNASFLAGEETITIDVAEAVITSAEAEVSLDSITTDAILTITFDENNTVTTVTINSLSAAEARNPGSVSGSFGGSGEVTQGTAVTIIDTDGSFDGESYSSDGDDENALRIDAASVTLTNPTVTKSGGASSNTEDGDFYGMNAALLATNGANVTISGAAVTSAAQNGNGVFSYGEGTIVTISDSKITTTGDNSGGIQTTGGGTTNATDLTVQTSGSSSAAIRSDRGGGTVSVNGGSYTTNGYNSPAVYSTASIYVENAVLTANNSEALVIEGQNSITLENCEVSGNMSDTEGTSSDENVHNVMIYQSMSGDAEVGTSEFSMTGGTLTSQNGDLFYITNTHCILTLSDVTISNNETDGRLLYVAGNSASHGWGTAAANGGQVEFTASAQTLEGDIVVDGISTLSMTLTDGSFFTGTITIVENAEGGTSVTDNADLTIESGCTFSLTGNCTLSSLTNHGTIIYNGYTITLSDGTVLSE